MDMVNSVQYEAWHHSLCRSINSTSNALRRIRLTALDYIAWSGTGNTARAADWDQFQRYMTPAPRTY